MENKGEGEEDERNSAERNDEIGSENGVLYIKLGGNHESMTDNGPPNGDGLMMTMMTVFVLDPHNHTYNGRGRYCAIPFSSFQTPKPLTQPHIHASIFVRLELCRIANEDD